MLSRLGSALLSRFDLVSTTARQFGYYPWRSSIYLLSLVSTHATMPMSSWCLDISRPRYTCTASPRHMDCLVLQWNVGYPHTIEPRLCAVCNSRCPVALKLSPTHALCMRDCVQRHHTLAIALLTLCAVHCRPVVFTVMRCAV